jgi:hypothetical protein
LSISSSVRPVHRIAATIFCTRSGCTALRNNAGNNGKFTVKKEITPVVQPFGPCGGQNKACLKRHFVLCLFLFIEIYKQVK